MRGMALSPLMFFYLYDMKVGNSMRIWMALDSTGLQALLND